MIRPPSPLRRLLGWTLPAGAVRDGLLGDLDELYAERATRGRTGADLWYARQLLTALVTYAPRRLAVWFGFTGGEGSMGGMERMGRDMAYAVRSLRRRPGMTAVIVLTLALGIGANTAVFSVVRSVLLRPLPYPEADRLAVLMLDMSQVGIPKGPPSPPEYVRYHDDLQSWEELATYSVGQATVVGDGEPERLTVARATWNLFPALRVEAQLGRTFTPDDDLPDADPVALLSDSYWRMRFGADPSAVGQSLTVNGITRTVVGVMPAGFTFPDPEVRFWVPAAFTAALLQQRGTHQYYVVGRLADGVTLAAAETELDAVTARVVADPGFNFHDWHPAFLRPLQTHIVGDVGRTLWIMLAAVGLVLLIACANVTNLLLARAEGRAREIALRTALGAGRGRLVAQLLTESAVLTGMGGLAAVGLAYVGVDALRALAPPELPRVSEISVDAGVLAFTLVVTLGAAVVFGLLPAMYVRRSDLQSTIRQEGRASTAGRTQMRLRQLLVVSETALAIVLLVSAGLLLQSFRKLLAVDPGFRTEQVLTASLIIPGPDYPEASDAVSFYETVLSRVSAIPGVTAAGAIRFGPLTGPIGPSNFEVEGWLDDPDEISPVAVIQVTTPGYFETMGIRLLEGRVFDPSDRADSPPVAVVSESVARRYWPEGAIGRRLQADEPGAQPTEIVGIVADIRQDRLDREPINGSLFFAHAQAPVSYPPSRFMTLAIRSAVDPAAVATAVRAVVRDLDSAVPVYDVRTMEQAVSDTTAPQRFVLLLQLVFAFVAAALAAVGLYGVLSYTVAQRTAEMGVRMALGAERGEVRRMVLRQGMGFVAAAVVVGVAGALAAGRLIETLLFEVSAAEPLVYLAVVALLVAVAFLACWVPARRASGVDPVVALRAD